ncbi:hypothetical protein [Pantoea sp. USHLN298]|uniref:hypothetical protein n=1 Tax=Pantoea sp. USHLN298 TaxID=3081294 RepID=UPI00301782FB
MKKVSKVLGAGLLIIAALFMVLFVFAQTTHLPSGSGEDNFWYVLAGFITLTSALCTLVFLLCPEKRIPLPLRLMTEVMAVRKKHWINMIFQH